MRRAVLLLASMALALLLATGVAQAIINGQPDTGPHAHPYVGAYMVEALEKKFKGQLLPVCSGTLVSARVFLTAGHCTQVEEKKDLPAYISFDPTYKPGASKVIRGTPHTHPQYCVPTPGAKKSCIPPGRPEIVGELPRDLRYDVGVVVLDEPVRMASYGALPDEALVDTLKEGQRLAVVGYGTTGLDIGGGPPPQPVYPDDRYRATVRLLQTKPAVSEMLVKTTGIGIGGGGEGTCVGDSGGPLFVPDQQTIVGVSSLVGYPLVPRLCRGPGFYQRVDLPQVLSWVRSFS